MTISNFRLRFKRLTEWVVITIALATFFAYWGCTCLFNFPESSVIIGENYRGYILFNSFFYQKWTFFAPPPTYNYRLHYVFVDSSKMVDAEVFENINHKVQQKFLVNDMYTNISWMLFSNVDAVINNMARYRKILAATEKIDPKDSLAVGRQYITARENVEHSKNMNMLLNHAKKVGAGLNIGPGYKLRMIVSTVDIPKYADRNKVRSTPKENIIFASSSYNSKTNQWER